MQENLEEINDPLLKLMPLLKNISKENVIPIIDFEDVTQVALNFLVVHVYPCIPSMSVNNEVSMFVPQDSSQAIEYVQIQDTKQVKIS